MSPFAPEDLTIRYPTGGLMNIQSTEDLWLSIMHAEDIPVVRCWNNIGFISS